MKLRSFLFVVMLLFMGLWVWKIDAQETPTVTRILQQKPIGFVVDNAQTLRPDHREMMEGLSRSIEKQSGIQIATVVLETLGDDTIDHVAVKLFEKWGIGQKGKNNGVLFLVAIKERKTRIEVGYGLEDVIPDGKAGEILDSAVIPFFKKGDLSTGILQGHLVIAKVIAEAKNLSLELPQQERAPQHRSGPNKMALIVVVVLALILLSRGGGGGLLPLLFLMGMGGENNRDSGSFGGDSFGGFGGGMSGGGGAGRDW